MSAKVGRPKGRQFNNMSISLTQEQINYLQEQPNASGLIRALIDDLIASKAVTESDLGVVKLNHRLETLEADRDKIFLERYKYDDKHRGDWVYEDGHPKLVGERPDFNDPHPIDLRNPEPLDTEDARIAAKVMQDYSNILAKYQQQIKETKKAILALE